MKITAPIRSATELEMLIHHGADELYCGIRTPQWEEHFAGRWWMNRRSPKGASVGSWQELATIAATAHGAGIPVYVTLNAPFYTEGSLAYLLHLVERLHAHGVDGIIASDINLLIRLWQEKAPLRIHLSSIATCLNSPSVGFYRDLGVQRIILPRQMRLSEIRDLVTAKGKQMEFEVFAVNDGCYYEEGFCQTNHALGGPFCLDRWRYEVRGDGLSSQRQEEHIASLSEYLWYQNNCGSSFQQDGLPNGPCSLCHFADFRDWGVTAVKIVGREASFHRKMGSLQLVKAVMDLTREGAGPERIAAYSRSLRKTPDHCDKGTMCYFDGR
jgi:putative protease